MATSASSKQITLAAVAGLGAGLAISALITGLRKRVAAKVHVPVFEDADRIAIFCGSSTPSDSTLALDVRAACDTLGKEMALRNIELVYGGGNLGIMGAIATAVHKHGGKVIGVIPRALSPKEVAGVPVQPENIIVVNSMHARKELMATLATRGFIALPGGFGTFDETVEMITWTQLGIHDKAVGVLNLRGFFDGLILQTQAAIDAGLIQERSRDILVVKNDAVELLNAVLKHRPPPGYLKWK